MRRCYVMACLIASAVVLFSSNLAAQVVPNSLSQGGSESTLREKKNDWTVGIVGGLFTGTYMRLAAEMASALDDGDKLRILPIVSFGAASNLDDLLYLHGVDLAITQSDVFEYFRTVRKTPHLERRVQYIIRLPISELHILARDNVHSLEDLRGKKVNFGPAGTGASLTGTIVFQRLAINVQQVMIDQSSALEKLKSGEIDAIARVLPKPVDFFSRIPPNSRLHLVNIPFTKVFEDYYTLGEFNKKDYPNLLDGKDSINNIAVPEVLAAYNRPRGQRSLCQDAALRAVSVHALGYVSASSIPSEVARRKLGGHRTGMDEIQRSRGYAAPGRGPAAAEAENQIPGLLRQTSRPCLRAERDALFQQFLQWQQSRTHYSIQCGQL